MSSIPQTLTILGLGFEFATIWITIRKLFWSYTRRLDETLTSQQRIKVERKEGSIVLAYLTLGMTLQALAILI